MGCMVTEEDIKGGHIAHEWSAIGTKLVGRILLCFLKSNTAIVLPKHVIAQKGEGESAGSC